jgi:hypothetical protein
MGGFVDAVAIHEESVTPNEDSDSESESIEVDYQNFVELWCKDMIAVTRTIPNLHLELVRIQKSKRLSEEQKGVLLQTLIRLMTVLRQMNSVLPEDLQVGLVRRSQ